MARSVLVSDLITNIRRRADYENNQHVTDAEILTYIDQAYGQYYGDLARGAFDFYNVETTFATVSGTRDYDLPADWFTTTNLDLLFDTTRYVELAFLYRDDRNQFNGFTSGTPEKWRLLNGKIALYPTPNAVQTIRHTYLPSPTAITTTVQTIDGLLGNEDLIELECAIRILQKEESDCRELIVERDRALDRLREAALLHSLQTERMQLSAVESGANDGDGMPYFGPRWL